MNTCPDYEIQILEYPELTEPARASLDEHLAGCEGCSQFLAALAEVDSSLGVAFPVGAELPSAVAARLLSRINETPPVKPSLLPEIFDLIGWASLIAALFAVVAFLAPREFQETAVRFAFAIVILAGSAWFVLQGWREFEKP